MKLIIQIPCYNEEHTLPQTLQALPRSLPGFEVVEWLVINDGSTDGTVKVAREHGVDHIISYASNRGLAHAFRTGLQASLDRGADVIVHTDADNQYAASSIPDLVLPVIKGEADVVVGDRQVWNHQEFGWVKKCLQRLGSRVVSHLSGISVPDVTSGFRAFSREAALALNVLSRYTYTHETLIQAGMQQLKVVSVPVKVNPATRPSRLFRSQTSYIFRSASTILRAYTMYRALKVFLLLAVPMFIAGQGCPVKNGYKL
jgi:glycosyltransferase involved in cell wall biosynthesis